MENNYGLSLCDRAQVSLKMPEEAFGKGTVLVAVETPRFWGFQDLVTSRKDRGIKWS